MPGVNPFVRNDLFLDDEKPFSVSRNHCMIERTGDRLFLRDRGSTLGTWVNGKQYGVRFGSIVAELNPGENDVVFGRLEGDQHYKLIVAG
jgi:pSer/pThr/pTyr-binding forkhead associated (FHA) protein